MVCTPEHLHVEPAVAALRAGKPAMVEKPIAHSLDAARAIADAASTAGVPLLVGHLLRFEPRWIAARQRLDAGAIGDVVSITTRRIGNVLDQEVLKGRTTIPLYYGVHDLDVMRWFAGAPAARSLRPAGAGAVRAAGYDVDDIYTAVLTFAERRSRDRGAGLACARRSSVGQDERSRDRRHTRRSSASSRAKPALSAGQTAVLIAPSMLFSGPMHTGFPVARSAWSSATLRIASAERALPPSRPRRRSKRFGSPWPWTKRRAPAHRLTFARTGVPELCQ